MPTSTPGAHDGLSALAFALEADLARFDKLADDLAHVPLRTEKGFARAKKLLVESEEVRERMGEAMQALAQLLLEKQRENERALVAIAEAAVRVQERHREIEPVLERFHILRDGVRTIIATIVGVRKAKGHDAIEERAALVQALPELTSSLMTLEGATSTLGDEARAADLKSLEENVRQLRQTIVSARRQLEAIPRTAAAPAANAFVPPVNVPPFST